MTTLTVAVPCYNSAAYLSRALDSLMELPSDLEVIIVNDGSTDNTEEIAKGYAARFNQIRVVNKENGGHGSAVNVGMREAKGDYFRVLDSDDWFDRQALERVLEVLRGQRGEPIDMLVTNYVYEKEGKAKHHVMRYANALPVDHGFTWSDVQRLRPSQAVLMHSLTYRTQLLRDVGLQLPEKTFYVDNLYAFVPLPAVKNMRYVDVNLYRYFIGRNDQSINEKVMIKRIDQQLFVNKQLISAMPQKDEVEKELYRYMLRFLGLVTAVSSVLLTKSGKPEHLELKKQLWQFFAETNPKAYRAVRHSLIGELVNLPTGAGRFVTRVGYGLAKKIFGFN